MSTEDLNREQKRQLRKSGVLDAEGKPVRGQRQAPVTRKPDEPRTSIPQYLREVKAEMAKVAWPSWPEVRKYSGVVLVAVLLFTLLVGGLDEIFNFFFGWLYS